MDQIKQKIEQANMDKKIAELQRRDTSDIERKIATSKSSSNI